MADVFIMVNGSDKFCGNQVEEFSAERIVTMLDEAGLDRAFILSEAYMLGMDRIAGPDEYNDVKKENNYLAIQCAKYPERLIGFFGVNPLKDYAIKEVDRCYHELKLPGLKLHFDNSLVDLKNPEHLQKIQELFSHAARRGIPILLHFRSEVPEFGKKDAEILINEVISKSPGLKLQIAHFGGWGGFDEVTEEVILTFIQAYDKNKDLDKNNIVFDISGVIVTDNKKIEGILPNTTEEQGQKIADYIRAWGIENIVFGSDWCFCSPARYIDNIKRMLPLSEAEIEQILSNDTSIRMFGSSEIRHPELEELLKTLKEGIDYSVPFSVKLGGWAQRDITVEIIGFFDILISKKYMF